MRTGMVDRQTSNVRWVALAALWVTLILVAGCAAVNGQQAMKDAESTLTLDELPIGLGRGYLVAGLVEDNSSQTEVKEGDLAPDFLLQSDDGRHLRLQDLQGRPVLINFWATWCGPCRLEMPELVATAKNHKELVVLAVNVQEELAQIEPFAEDFAMTIPIVRDTDGALRQTYRVRGMPTSIFIDKEGKVAAVWSGLLTKKLLKQFITKIE
ncbi:MAG: TlpA disulfide reductase family protein [Caldilineaceae bacterium]